MSGATMHGLVRRGVAWALSVAAIAGLAPGSTLAATADPLKTCGPFRTASDARSDPSGAACPALPEIQRALASPSSVDDDGLVRLRATVAQAVAERPAACTARLGEALAEATECGSAFDAVAIRVVTAAAVEGAQAAAVLRRSGACQWKLVSALREAERVDPAVATAIWDLTRSDDPDVRAAAWLTLGTLERIARLADQTDVERCIDGAIGASLGAARSEERTVLLMAAGNAGCASCRSSLRDGARSDDPTARRRALGALRFSAERQDVETLCDAARGDADEAVRAAAAYALRHATTFAAERLSCLGEVARDDTSARVAGDAVASIVALAAAGDLAVGTLVRVARSARHLEIRRAAAEELEAFASPAAIDEALLVDRE